MKYILLIFSALFYLTANAGITFDLQGTQMDAVYSSNGAQAFPTYYSLDTKPQSIALNTAGVFGGHVISLNNGVFSNDKWLAYAGYKNWTGSNAFSIRLRIVPGFTCGSITAPVGLFVAGIPQESQSGSYFHLLVNTNCTVEFNLDDHVLGVSILHTTPVFSFTNGLPTDVMFTYQEGASPNIQASQDGVSIESTTVAPGLGIITGLYKRWIEWPFMTFGKFPGQSNATSQSNLSYNEVEIWDDVEPYTYAVRTNFDPVPVYDGYLHPAPVLNAESVAPFPTQNAVNLTQGNTAVIEMVAMENGKPVDLTNAVLTTQVTAPSSGLVTIPSNHHVINSDQFNFRGHYLVQIYAVDSNGMAALNGHEVITQVTQNGASRYFHAPAALNVVPNTPNP